ncbi:MAG: transcriptional regulator [Myxococcaceae bacterium]
MDKWSLLERYAPGRREEALADALVTVISTARAQWPGVGLDDHDFAAFLAARTAGPLEQVRGSELFVAWAALQRDPAALAALDGQFISKIDKAVASIDANPAFIDEVRQLVRERLLIGERPRLLEYSGQGSLAGWVRTVALRLALNHRSNGREVSDEGLMDVVAHSGRNVELDFVRAQHRAAFTAAFQEALAALDSRSRNLLRLSYVDRLSIDQLGTMYGTHRSTAARWLAAARDELVQATHRRISERLKLTESDVQSLVGDLQSHLEVSVNRLLRED